MIEVLSQSPGGGLQWRGVAALAAQAGRFLALVALWRRRAQERRSLAGMNDRLLRDIGLTRLDAARECGKPFWRA